VKTALGDTDVNVAATGARLSERFLATGNNEAFDAMAARIKAGEPEFLRQAALSLGAGSPEKADELLLQLALRHGALPFIADALVSSWKGREAAVLEKVTKGGTGVRSVIASLSAAILKSGDATQIDALFARLEPQDARGKELTDAILDGVERFIPGTGARSRTAFLPKEPAALAAFARTIGPQSTRAADSLKFLRWRGQQIDETTALATLSEPERKRFERGREEFKLCAACHQPQGQGQPGLAPPLVGSPWVNGGTGAAIRIVLQGKTSGETTMPPLAALDDEQIASILTFVRRSWGHEASPVAAGDVQAVRSETRLREEPWNENDLASFN
jgi:mono/diheme cytochrome c family protein